MKHQAMNPYLPLYEYIPDGEPRIFGERLYLYGSHDKAGSSQFCVGNYVVWSAPLDDLGDWRYEGVSYTYAQTGASLAAAGNLAAPTAYKARTGAITCSITAARAMPARWRSATGPRGLSNT